MKYIVKHIKIIQVVVENSQGGNFPRRAIFVRGKFSGGFFSLEGNFPEDNYPIEEQFSEWQFSREQFFGNNFPRALISIHK